MKREQIIETIKSILTRHGIRRAYLFGSFARNERKYNDIDIAVEPPEGFSLLDMAGVLVELEDEVGKKVDLVSTRSINPRLEGYIRKDSVAII